LPILLKRLQFLVRLAFAMTINKSQEQSVEHMGINLQTLVFSHRQHYVVFSKYTLLLNISVLLSEQSQKSKKSVRIVKLISDWKNITEYTESSKRKYSRLTLTYTQLFRINREFKLDYKPKWKSHLKKYAISYIK